MALIIADRVREAATVTGTGDYTLSGAVTNFRPFNSVMSNGDTTWAFATSTAGGWEVAIVTLSSGILQRTTVLASSNSGSKVNFNAGGSGTVDVSLGFPVAMAMVYGLTAHTTPQGADVLSIWDSVANQLKKLSLTNLLAWIASAVSTFTNKRITKRVVSTASTSTLTVDSDSYDASMLTAQAASLTVAAPTGSPTDGQPLLYYFKDNGSARAISWNSAFVAVGVTIPTTTVAGKMLYVMTVWSAATSKWNVIAVGQQA